MGNVISFEFIDNNMQPLVLYEGNTSNEKGNYHTSVVTDVYGQSTSKTINGLVGVETHLVYLEDKQNLGLQNRFYIPSNHYQQKVFFLGKSNQIPDRVNLVNALFTNMHSDYYDTVKIQKWSANNNCQTYSKYIIDRLGLTWPEELQFLPLERGNVLQLVELYNDIKNSTH
ncbi:hypothetical protein DDB_G0281973 [Dictyostelium discoideum AX4]|uniref:Uncharacterized protein n=1 Tax=Dictyostelium discoideum TaxID=44689 RepID=Q54T67_DICDI|nr:hypothetical protein DDB_G0281973 [Dictyostelium discoideum AX4]EAL66408.1 hypothetical protein DDB_G0281973 [Dictyostelium discoideum AX4]|eukprot:XP_640384.1 hypothetical protein DDB_G0281973 [Dictyostelium discoideum AX4]